MKNSRVLEITLLLASTLTILANAIIAPSLPLISNAFKEVENVELLAKLMLTLPALTIAVVAPLFGKLLDKAGRIRILILSLLIYLFAGTSGYWLSNLYAILFGRFIFGFGVAGIMTVSTTLIGDYFTGEKREHFMGLQGAFVALGGLLFITTAGILTDISWRYTFLIYAFSAVVLVLVPIALFEPKTASQDFASEPQKTGTVPSIVWLVFFSAFITTVSFYVIPVQLPFFLQNMEGITGNKMGLALGCLPFAQAITSFFYKRIKKHFDFISIYILGFILMAAGFTILSFSNDFWQVISGVLICGMGVGLLIPNANLWVLTLVPNYARGKYIGFLTTATFSGMFLSPVITQPVQRWVGLSRSFIVLGSGLVFLSLMYLIIRKRINLRHN